MAALGNGGPKPNTSIRNTGYHQNSIKHKLEAANDCLLVTKSAIKAYNLPPTPRLTFCGNVSSLKAAVSAKTSIGGATGTFSNQLDFAILVVKVVVSVCWLAFGLLERKLLIVSKQ